MPKTKLDRVIEATTDREATTDGTYIGTMKQVQKEQDRHNARVKQAIDDANARLKAAKARVAIVRVGGSLFLQATLPLKPDETDKNGKEKKQYKISMGMPASIDGVRTAEEEANELAKLIARKTFEWTDKYLGKKQDKTEKTFGELFDDYEDIYFSSRTKTRKSENTYKNYRMCLKNFDRDIIATPENLKKQFDAISSEKAHWKHRVKIALNLFCKTFGIDLRVDFKNPKPGDRNVPTDLSIEKGFLMFEEYAKGRRNKREEQAENWRVFRWFYGMLAVFGCRPSELIIYPDFEHWMSDNNRWRVHKTCKTGARECVALHPEWIEKFDLKNPEIISLVKDYIGGRESNNAISGLARAIPQWFQKIELGFKPYDLRHAWAIRAHMLKVPIKASADNMGHTVEQHTETYQRHFGLDNRIKAINQAVNQKSEIDELKERNAMLEQENINLKSEIEELRKLVSDKQAMKALVN